jgi:hypothetical protein
MKNILILFLILISCQNRTIAPEFENKLNGSWFEGLVIQHNDSFVCSSGKCDTTHHPDTLVNANKLTTKSIIKFIGNRFYHYSDSNGILTMQKDTGEYEIISDSFLIVNNQPDNHGIVIIGSISIGSQLLRITNTQNGNIIDKIYYPYE